METRITALRRDACPELAAVLNEAEREIRAYRAVRDDTSYLLSVVQPR